MSIAREIPAPSVIGRALTTLALLAGFYALNLGLAVVLLALPPAYLYFAGETIKPRVLVLLLAVCWLPAITLLSGVIGVRRSKHRDNGRPIARADAPELFALLDDLASGAGVAPPHAVYLTSEP